MEWGQKQIVICEILIIKDFQVHLDKFDSCTKCKMFYLLLTIKEHNTVLVLFLYKYLGFIL